MAARIDPALCAQLERAAAGDEPVEAVIAVRRDGETGADARAIAEDLLGRAARESGSEALDVNVFRNLGSFVVVASPAFVRALTAQPEVESAMANRQPEPVIEPLRQP